MQSGVAKATLAIIEKPETDGWYGDPYRDEYEYATWFEPIFAKGRFTEGVLENTVFVKHSIDHWGSGRWAPYGPSLSVPPLKTLPRIAPILRELGTRKEI